MASRRSTCRTFSSVFIAFPAKPAKTGRAWDLPLSAKSYWHTAERSPARASWDRERCFGLNCQHEDAFLSVDSNRPSPEHFLTLIRQQQRGRLKVYLGFAAGVGKTF